MGVAEKFAGLNVVKLPQFYIVGGASGGNGNTYALMQILTMMMAQQTMNNNGKKSINGFKSNNYKRK